MPTNNSMSLSHFVMFVCQIFSSECPTAPETIPNSSQLKNLFGSTALGDNDSMACFTKNPNVGIFCRILCANGAHISSAHDNIPLAFLGILYSFLFL